MGTTAPAFGVLGPLEVQGADGPVPVAGARQRALLALLLAARGVPVSADELAEALWADDDRPANPAAALQSQVARLRRTLASPLEAVDGELVTRPPGYALLVDDDQVDARRFEHLLARAREASGHRVVGLFDDALALWRGSAYAEVADVEALRLDGIRLDQLHLSAHEDRAAALVDAGRADEVVAELEAFVVAHPLREAAVGTLVRALYMEGRHADAVARYQDHRRTLAEELGLEPSSAMKHLEQQVLAHDVAGVDAELPAAEDPRTAGRLADLAVRFVPRADGSTVAVASGGEGHHVVVVPAWVSNLDVLVEGRDVRGLLAERLVAEARVTLYDRAGTGLTDGALDDASLAASVDELLDVLAAVGPGVLLAVSQAGPVAVAAAVRRPDLVRGLVLFGTFADGTALFTDEAQNRTLVELVRVSWAMGSRAFAGLFRPGVSSEAVEEIARVLRRSAPGEVAAAYLEQAYRYDVATQLGEVSVPALVLHYRGDRMVPIEGGRQLARGIAGARLVTLDGDYHLPDIGDLPRITELVAELLEQVDDVRGI